MSDTPHNDDSNAGADWITPAWLWKPLAESLGGFDLDPAAGPEPEPIADERFIGPPNGTDGLKAGWHGHVYLNHAYGRSTNPKWADKVAIECANPDVKTITALLPASSGTAWYKRGFSHADYKTEFHQRIEFESPDENDDNGASFASVVHSFEVSEAFPVEYLQALDTLGSEHPDKEMPSTTWGRMIEGGV